MISENILPMTQKEIVYMYKFAADRSKQLHILAQLNACSILTIKTILKNEGVLDEKDLKAKTGHRPRSKIDEALLEAFLKQNMSYEQIARIFGVSSSTIHNRSHERGFSKGYHS